MPFFKKAFQLVKFSVINHFQRLNSLTHNSLKSLRTFVLAAKQKSSIKDAGLARLNPESYFSVFVRVSREAAVPARLSDILASLGSN